jgi:hypothetical protein
MLRFFFLVILALMILSASAFAQDPAVRKPSQESTPARGADAQVQARINQLIKLINLKPNLVTVNQSHQVVKDPNHQPYNPDGTRSQDFTVRPDHSHPSISQAINVEQNRETWTRELIQIGKPAVSALVKALTYEGHEYREYYARALGGIGDLRAVPAVLKYYQDGVIQVNLAKMIRSSGDQAAAMECEKKGQTMKQAAVQALEQISGQKFGDDLAKWNQWWIENKAKVEPLPVPKHYSANPAPSSP